MVRIAGIAEEDHSLNADSRNGPYAARDLHGLISNVIAEKWNGNRNGGNETWPDC